MPIPPLNANGLLPPGLHETTLDEIRDRFGVIVAERASAVYQPYVEFFSRVRDSTELRKGILSSAL